MRDVIAAAPELATVTSETYGTPLFWLPEDEAGAKAIVTLFLASGADPAFTNKEGQTAADRADKRGLFNVAEVLRSASGSFAKNARG